MDASTCGNTPCTWNARGLVFKLRSLIAVITMRYLWTKVHQWVQCGCKLIIASVYCKALVTICITNGGPVIGCNCSSSKQVKICSPILLRKISFLQTKLPWFHAIFTMCNALSSNSARPLYWQHFDPWALPSPTHNAAHPQHAAVATKENYIRMAQ
jgi:hypothetical protein